jgi:hypoxanthine-guanine phosphoribosyltransferase
MGLKDVSLENYEIFATETDIKAQLKLTSMRIEEKVGLDAVVGIVPILKGGIYVGMDLARLLNTKVYIDFVKVSLYGDMRTIDFDITEFKPDKYFKFELEPNYNKLSECDLIVIVDDICDTGLTLWITKEKIVKNLKKRVPINTYTLINVTDNQEFKVLTPDFWSFNGSVDNWFFGYGMDYNEGLFINVNFIGKVNRFED